MVSETQTACALVLCFDLCKAEHRAAIVRALKENLQKHGYHLTTGFIGTRYLLQALSENGCHDLAGKLLLNDDYPSWLREVQLGATTIWERWDSLRDDGSLDESGMNSFNHYAFGSVGAWMLETLAGIRAAKPGYEEILLQPRFIHGLTHVHALRETPYGKLACGWTCKDGTITVEVTVPVNTTAILHLPEKESPVTLGSGKYVYRYPTSTCLEKQKYSMDTTIGELIQNPLAVKCMAEALPGTGQMLGMAFLQSKTLGDLAAMSPPGTEALLSSLLTWLNASSC